MYIGDFCIDEKKRQKDFQCISFDAFINKMAKTTTDKSKYFLFSK